MLAEFLKFFTENIELIIQWSLFLIVVLVTLLGILMYFFKGETTDSALASSQLEGLEETLKKLIESAQMPNSKLVQVSGDAVADSLEDLEADRKAGAPVADPAEASAESEKLLAELKEKETAIAEMKKQLEEASQAKGGADPAEMEKLMKQIGDLEARLAEYEIIEDDIADLSKYKEENTRLQAELDALKGGGAASVAVEEPAAAAPAAAVEEAAEAVTEAPAAEPTAEPATAEAAPEPAAVAADEPPEEAPEPDPLADDLVAEFESAVNKQKETLVAEAEMNQNLAGSEAAPAEDDADEDDDDAGAGDLFAEFEGSDEDVEGVEASSDQPAGAEVAAAAPASEAGTTGLDVEAEGIDTDKMMAEMAGLENLDPKAGEGALEEEMDVEKMAAEAGSLASES